MGLSKSQKILQWWNIIYSVLKACLRALERRNTFGKRDCAVGCFANNDLHQAKHFITEQNWFVQMVEALKLNVKIFDQKLDLVMEFAPSLKARARRVGLEYTLWNFRYLTLNLKLGLFFSQLLFCRTEILGLNLEWSTILTKCVSKWIGSFIKSIQSRVPSWGPLIACPMDFQWQNWNVPFLREQLGVHLNKLIDVDMVVQKQYG